MRGSAVLGFAVIATIATLGCRSLDVAPSTSPDRVLTGSVNAGATMPGGAEIVVRLLAASGVEAVRMPVHDVPVPTRPVMPPAERMLGEFTTTLAEAANQPVPFTIRFQADDALLRRGVNVEARVSVAGRVRYRTINAHVVTLNSVRFPQEISVQPVSR